MINAVLEIFGAGLSSCWGLAGDLGNSVAEINFPLLVLALFLFAAMQLLRARSWQNILRSAFPKAEVSYTQVSTTYLLGAGLNAILPAKIGEATKLMVIKPELGREATYPALASTLLTLTVFDTIIGIVVMAYALHLGLLAALPLPAFSLTWLLVAFLALSLLAWASHHSLYLRAFFKKLALGANALRDPGYYLRRVASYQALGWLLRFCSFSVMLSAFGVSGHFSNVLLVMSIQAAAGIIPFAPGGGGAQQALMVAALSGSSGAILFYSVGAAIAVTGLSVALAILALAWLFPGLPVRQWFHTLRPKSLTEPLPEPTS